MYKTHAGTCISLWLFVSLLFFDSPDGHVVCKHVVLYYMYSVIFMILCTNKIILQYTHSWGLPPVYELCLKSSIPSSSGIRIDITSRGVDF